MLLGGSVYVGNSGQKQDVGGVDIPNTLTTLWEIHTQLRAHGFQVRGLVSYTHVDQAGRLSRALGPAGTGDLEAGQAVAQRMFGAYGEVSYEVLQWILTEGDREMTLEPFFRMEWVDTQDDMPDGFAADRAEACCCWC